VVASLLEPASRTGAAVTQVPPEPVAIIRMARIATTIKTINILTNRLRFS